MIEEDGDEVVITLEPEIIALLTSFLTKDKDALMALAGIGTSIPILELAISLMLIIDVLIYNLEEAGVGTKLEILERLGIMVARGKEPNG